MTEIKYIGEPRVGAQLLAIDRHLHSPCHVFIYSEEPTLSQVVKDVGWGNNNRIRQGGFRVEVGLLWENSTRIKRTREMWLWKNQPKILDPYYKIPDCSLVGTNKGYTRVGISATMAGVVVIKPGVCIAKGICDLYDRDPLIGNFGGLDLEALGRLHPTKGYFDRQLYPWKGSCTLKPVGRCGSVCFC